MVTPPRDPGPLTIDDSDLVDWPHQKLARIHGTVGPRTLPWHQLRHFGPMSTRFDPHPPPPTTHPDFAVMYAAADVDTALSEVFQRGRVIEPTAPNGPHLTVWTAARVLRLLDLRGTWPIRQGASQTITGPQPVCRRWAHAIAVHPKAVDGLLYTSSMTGANSAALFLPAADSFPPHPDLSISLSDPGIVAALESAAARISYTII